jgi:NADH-quinone oxidoreductase subunit J
MTAAHITFYALGALILLFACLVVTTKNTVHGILFLVIDFLAVALLYAAMNSMFVAAIQVLVYAGGIVVLYLFVVMLVKLHPGQEDVIDPRRQSAWGGIIAAAVLVELAVLAVYNAVSPTLPAEAVSTAGFVEPIGMALYTDYLIPFELASVLLLVAMVGAIILARREI